MKTKTHQQTFSQAIRGMLKQRKLSNTPDGKCYYRSPDGLRCVAGQLIPDRLYKPSMENTSVENGVETRRAMNKLGHDADFVQLLQEIHDCASDFSAFKKDVRHFAKEHDLKMPSVRK